MAAGQIQEKATQIYMWQVDLAQKVNNTVEIEGILVCHSQASYVRGQVKRGKGTEAISLLHFEVIDWTQPSINTVQWKKHLNCFFFAKIRLKGIVRL